MFTSLAYQYPHTIKRLRFTFRTGFREQGSIRRETRDIFTPSNEDRKEHTDQQSLVQQQANVDDYLNFLERRYKRLNDDSIAASKSPSFAWNWLLETNNENERQSHRKEALHVLGVANLASRKLLEKDRMYSRSLIRRLSSQSIGLLQWQSISHRGILGVLNILIKRALKRLQSTTDKRRNTLTVIAAAAFDIIYLVVLHVANLMPPPQVMLCVYHSVCLRSLRKTIIQQSK